MLNRDSIAACFEIHTKHINPLCGQNVEFLNVKSCDAQNNHWTLMGLGLSQSEQPYGTKYNGIFIIDCRGTFWSRLLFQNFLARQRKPTKYLSNWELKKIFRVFTTSSCSSWGTCNPTVVTTQRLKHATGNNSQNTGSSFRHIFLTSPFFSFITPSPRTCTIFQSIEA